MTGDSHPGDGPGYDGSGSLANDFQALLRAPGDGDLEIYPAILVPPSD